MARTKRLYESFKPNSYQLSLILNQKARTFRGELQIEGFKKGRPSSRITLHQSGLKIESAKLKFLDKKLGESEVPITRIVHQKKLQQLRLHSANQLQPGKYQIELTYSGKIYPNQTNGIYLSTWHDNSNNLHELTATQFQPHYARQLLPCIDEPEAKATLSLILQTPQSKELSQGKKSHQNTESYQAYSNMPLESTSTTDSKIIYKFQTSPPMSSYLFALAYGEFAQTSTQTKSGIKLSVISTPNKQEHTAFALDFASKALDFLEEYFCVPYPLQKCDLIAVPDFDAGGMENWGLITFREDLLLFDAESSTLADKQAIALVIAHELAHQWFGNLVTMRWWDELWLNEGFANFMEFFVVDHFFPEWKILEEYLVSEKSAAMRLDSLPSSKPIIRKVSTASQTNQAFDEIAYEKSGSLIRMLHNLLGSKSFQAGLKDYFQKYQYSNATSQDLLNCWQKYTKLNLSKFSKNWLYQAGYPVLNLKLNKNYQDQFYQIEVTQKRFLSETITKLNPQKEAQKLLQTQPHLKKLQKEFRLNQILNSYQKEQSAAKNLTWQVPIDFVSPPNLQTPDLQSPNLKPFLLQKQKHIIQLKPNQNLPIKLNQNGTGLYLVNYPLEMLAQIINTIRQGELPETEIISLLSDFIILSRSSKLNVGSPAVLEILNMAKLSLNPHFWSLAGGFLATINQHLKQEDQQNLLCPFSAQLIEQSLNQLGLEFKLSDSNLQTAMRFELISIGLMARQPKVLQYLQNQYDSISPSYTQLHPESRILTLFAVAKRGDKKDFNLLLQDYKEFYEDLSLREDIAYALCSFEGASFQQQVLNLMQDGQYVRNQDILSWLSNILYASKNAKLKLLEWLFNKDSGWNWLKQNLSPFDLNIAVRTFCSSAYTNKEINKLIKFFKQETEHDLAKPIQEASELAKARIKWHKKELPAVIQYLKEQQTSKLNSPL